jgi:hypothetical protein
MTWKEAHIPIIICFDLMIGAIVGFLVGLMVGFFVGFFLEFFIGFFARSIVGAKQCRLVINDLGKVLTQPTKQPLTSPIVVFEL